MVKISIFLYIYKFFFLLSFLVTKTQEQYNEIISFNSSHPNSLTLNNGNILIVAQKGIYLYNQLNYNINAIKEFPSDLYISNETIATKTTILQLPEKEGGYIIIFANDILYGLPPDANSITTFGKTNETNANYYSLSFFKIDENNNIFYTFGYSDLSNKFRLSYYKLNIDSNSNNLIYSKEHEAINSLGKLQNKFNTGISCERMNHVSLGKLLVCFHENRGKIGEISISIFNPENNFEIISLNPTIYISNSNFVIVIKSTISNSYKKSFVCYLLNAGIGAYCFFYYIDENTYTEPIEYSTYCKPNSMSIRAYFFPQTHKFLFACGSSEEFICYLFNEEDNKSYLTTEKNRIENCHSYESLSISFSSNDLNYLMIIDAYCGTLSKRTRIYTIEYIKNITIYFPSSESLQTSKYYSSSINVPYSLLSDDKLTTIPLVSNSITNNINYTNPLSSSFLSNSSLSSTSLFTTSLYTSPLSSTSLNTYSLSSTSLYTSSLSSTSNHLSEISSFSSTNILFSNSISSISINKNSQFLTSSIENEDLISYDSFLKCEKYLNYERNKCIDFIPLGFYLYDQKKGLIEKCHESCNSCIIGPNENSNNCDQCKNNSYYLDNGNCIMNYLCPNERPLFNIKINECVEQSTAEEMLKKKCIINRVSDDSLEIINKNIRQIIYNLTMNETINIIIEGNNIIYQISTTNIVKNNLHDYLSSIDFGDCENKIKEEYQTDYIIIQKTDINYNNMTIVKYELYNPKNKE